MGKKGVLKNQVKRAKSVKLSGKIAKISKNSAVKADIDKSTKKKGKSLKQQRRTNAEFQQKINDLKERNIGSTKPKSQISKALDIKPPTFVLPSNADESRKQTFAVDELLQGEETAGDKNQRTKKAQTLSFVNRFSILENDELLEDGTHSILKMDVKPATFSLPNR